MNRFTNILFVSLLLMTQSSHITARNMIRVYSCNSVTGTYCDLFNVFLEDENIRFMPSSRNPKQITKVTLRSSTVPVLTSDICETFPNTEKLEIQGVGLKRIDEDAFVGCPKLKEIVVYGNSIVKLHPDTFKFNPLLEVISFWNNKLEEIQPELFFNLTNLKTLNLYGNLLTEIPDGSLVTVENLKELRLHHNPIADLDAYAMLEYLPNLKEINIQDTDMECDRLKEVISIFRGAGITVSTLSWQLRSRSYKVSTVDGFYCLTNEQYQKEMLMKTLPSTLAEIKFKLGIFPNTSIIDYSTRLNALEEAVEEVKQENVILKQKIEDLESKNVEKNTITPSLESKIDHQITVIDKFLEMQETANRLLWEKVQKLEGKSDEKTIVTLAL